MKVSLQGPLLDAKYHKTKLWTQCLSQLHKRTATSVQFFLTVMAASILKTSVAIDTSPTSKKHWRECRLCPLYTVEVVRQLQELLHWAEKNVQIATTCRSATALLKRNHSHFLRSQFLPFPLPLLNPSHTTCTESQLKALAYAQNITPDLPSVRFCPYDGLEIARNSITVIPTIFVLTRSFCVNTSYYISHIHIYTFFHRSNREHDTHKFNCYDTGTTEDACDFGSSAKPSAQLYTLGSQALQLSCSKNYHIQCLNRN